MAQSFKQITDNDRVSIRTPLYESVSFTYTDISQSSEQNLLSGSANMFVSFYDGNTSTSTSNLMFDMTIGRSPDTTTGSATTVADFTKEKNIYQQMAKVLYGTDVTGAIYRLDLDFDDNTSNDYVLHNSIFINLARGQIKDEIRKGTFALTMSVSGAAGSVGADYVYLLDVSGTTNYKSDSPVGEYGALYVVSASSNAVTASTINPIQGLVFYQAGVAVLSPYIFAISSSNAVPSTTNTAISSSKYGILTASMGATTLTNSTETGNIGYYFSSGSITGSIEAIMKQIDAISYQSTTEINSTVYFCRVFNNEFNYSSNPTYLSGSEVVVKGGDPLNLPVSYITTVGLYSDDNQLLAVAKLSEPIKKTPENELILRTRLDF